MTSVSTPMYPGMDLWFWRQALPTVRSPNLDGSEKIARKNLSSGSPWSPSRICENRVWTGILFCVNISNALDYSDYCKIFLQWENISCWRMTRFRICRHFRDLRTIKRERPPLRTKVRRRWSSYRLDIYFVTCVRVGRMKRVEVKIQSTRKTNFRTMG